MFTHGSQRTTVLGSGRLTRYSLSQLGRLGTRLEFITLRLSRWMEWLTHRMTTAKATNLLSAILHFAAHSGEAAPYPVCVIIDISPLCNLHCTVCLHAIPHGQPALEKQRFCANQMMSLEQYCRIIEEIKGHTLGVWLFYMGDPLMHPRLEEICRLTSQAGLNANVSTNFSFPLTDARIRGLITSGLTNLTVCLDGLSQQKYGMTRVGGRLPLVMANLQRACEIRRSLGKSHPRIEVQYIKFQHNLDELAEARRVLRQMGVDQIHEMWGWLHNYTERDPGRFDVFEPSPDRHLPSCHWPYLFTLVKYNGDVIPCCAYRVGLQYSPGDDPRVIGNVFKTSLRKVWRSPQYRALRQWVSCPSLIRQQPALSKTFCDGCPRLFETNYTDRTCRFADEYRFEDLYCIGPDGYPRRREESCTTARSRPA